jgi:3',5'-cyclic AMP phosphodiesterase CpdA
VPGRLGMERRYSYFDHRGFRFAILDTNDVSTYAYASGTPEYAAATLELARLEAANVPQAKPWNGAIGAAQLAWLDRLCREAREQRLKVMVLAHHPLLPAATDLLWNAGEVLALIGRHPQVVAWLNGHNHRGALAEAGGVPLLTMHGMVETPDTTAFATAQVLDDRMIIAGHGREPSRELVFRKTA